MSLNLKGETNDHKVTSGWNQGYRHVCVVKHIYGFPCFLLYIGKWTLCQSILKKIMTKLMKLC
jgi:hypothetical protein